MAIDVTEATFEAEVLQRSRETPVVVDFWAEWCGPCRTLGPALERAEESRGGEVILAKVDVDSNPGLSQRYGIQGIPAVKAFRDGEIAEEFTGAVPPARVEQFFDSLVPSKVDRLIAEGGESSLREAVALEPGRADAALPLARLLRDGGDTDAALEVLGRVNGSFAADGLAARIGLAEDPDEDLRAALEAVDSGRTEEGLDALLGILEASEDGRRDDLRRAVVGILDELGPGDPRTRDYRRRLAVILN